MDETAMLDLQNIPRRSSETAKKVRNEFARYVNSPQRNVPWQNNFV